MSGSGLASDVVEDGFDELLGFGARDEGVSRDAEGEAEEFLLASEVLQRFMCGAAGGESVELREVFGGEWVVNVREDERAVALKDVREEGFGIARRDVRGGFGDGLAEGQGFVKSKR